MVLLLDLLNTPDARFGVMFTDILLLLTVSVMVLFSANASPQNKLALDKSATTNNTTKLKPVFRIAAFLQQPKDELQAVSLLTLSLTII
jgi:hypothetical protein